MSGDRNVAPVIIKRKKVVAGGGHHGGAWKVAYADFVTAMMAFFMLMWLLNATTEKQRKGLADYFNPTVAIARVSGGGDGSLGGDSVFSENVLPRMGTGATNLRPTEQNGTRGSFSAGAERAAQEGSGDNEAFAEVETMLAARTGESEVAEDLLRHIVTRVTDEGLVVELYETDRNRLFDASGAPTRLLGELAGVIVRVADMVSNPIAVEGHVSAFPLVVAENPSWKVAADRATAFRMMLEAQGLAEARVQRMTSHADREPASDNPMSRRNDRLEIVFLRVP